MPVCFHRRCATVLGVIDRLDFYEIGDIVKIIQRSAKILGLEISEEGAYALACSSRGTPRVANRLLRRVRDFAQVKAAGGDISGRRSPSGSGYAGA